MCVPTVSIELASHARIRPTMHIKDGLVLTNITQNSSFITCKKQTIKQYTGIT